MATDGRNGDYLVRFHFNGGAHGFWWTDDYSEAIDVAHERMDAPLANPPSWCEVRDSVTGKLYYKTPQCMAYNPNYSVAEARDDG